MKLYSISASVRKQQSTTKFSPGLPHNQTCGCWRGGGNQTSAAIINVGLNASWIVSGLTFKADRRQWLRRFSVAASGDNTTFLEWGNYTRSNSSSVVLFRYPVRTTFLRLTVHEYINHMINASTGFPVHLNVLVSDSEPFGCECASLPTGECCPMPNMEVKDGACVLCMDPSSINTVMVDGCGRCKPGTRQHGASQQCVVNFPMENDRNIAMTVSRANATKHEWTAQVEVPTSGDPALILFLMGGGNLPCSFPFSTSACFTDLVRDFIPVLWDVDLFNASGVVSRIDRALNPQYIQFDRGRESTNLITLAMNESAVRSWARCDPSQCTGTLVGMFLSLGSSHEFGVQVITQPLSFEFFRPNSLVCGFSRGGPPLTVELHHLLDLDRFLLWPSPIPPLSVQWDNQVPKESNGTLSPPTAWSSLRVFSGDRQFLLTPSSIVRRSSWTEVATNRDSVRVDIRYGLALKTAPDPGDSEQLVIITARSKQPIRLARMASVAAGVTTMYTALSKGFTIIDPARVLDLVVACNGGADALVAWLGSALGLMGHHVEPFVQEMCAHSKTVSKLYWLVPYRPIGTRRDERVDVRVSIDFI